MTDSSQSSRGAGWDRAILLVLAVVWMFAMACMAVGGHDRNADEAVSPLQAGDILQGNVFLSSWSVPMDNYYTLDVALSTLLGAGLGVTPGIFVVQSALVFLTVGLVAFALARRNCAASWITLAVLMFFLGWPGMPTAKMMLMLINHMVTLACALLGLWGLSRLYDPSGGGWRKYFWPVYGLAFFLAAAGDPFIWYIAGLPFITAGAVVAWRERDWRPWRQSLVVTLVAGLAAKALVLGLEHQGFQIINFRSSFLGYLVSWNRLPFNFYQDGRSVLLLFGWPLGQPAMAGEFFAVLRMLGGVGAVMATLAVIRKPAGESSRYYVDYALLLGILFNQASFIASNLPVNDATTRYLLPSFVYVAILAARRGGPCFSKQWAGAPAWARPVVLVSLMGAVGLISSPLWMLAQTPVNARDQQLADWLLRHGLQRGYADYWQSNIVTLLSGGKVQVAQTIVNPAGRLVPYHWNSKADWYREPANFYICLPDDDHSRAARATFGPASAVDQVGQYRVMIWNHNIQPSLRDYAEIINPTELPLNVATMWQLLAPGVTIDSQGHVVDEQPRTQPAVIVYGPYARLPAGRYKVQFVLAMTGAAPGDTVICEATIRKGDVVLNRKSFSGAEFNGPEPGKTVTLAVASPGSDEPVEFRVWKSGKGKLTLLSLTLDNY